MYEVYGYYYTCSAVLVKPKVIIIRFSNALPYPDKM